MSATFVGLGDPLPGDCGQQVRVGHSYVFLIHEVLFLLFLAVSAVLGVRPCWAIGDVLNLKTWIFANEIAKSNVT